MIVEKIFEYQEGIENILFFTTVDGPLIDHPERKKLKILEKCPLNGETIKYTEPPDDLDYFFKEEYFDYTIIPSPCDGCGCFQPVNDLKEDYGVSGVCKRYCEIDPNKITLLRWM